MATQSTSEQADNPPRYDSIQPRSAVIDCMQAPAAPAAPERTIPRESPWLLPVINPTLLSIKRLCKGNRSSRYFTNKTTTGSPRHSRAIL